MENLWDYDSFINENNPFIFNTQITEYDMKEAGFSLIKEFKLLSDKEIEKLERMGKDRRKIEIGLIQRSNEELKQSMKEAFKIARKLFYDANNIEKNDIISVKKDAIFTTKLCKKQSVGKYILFRPKNTYTSYINLGKKMEFYYSDNHVDVKGLNDENYKKHEKYMINLIIKFFVKMETEDPENVIGFMRRFITKYKNKEVDIGYYRSFDHISMYSTTIDDILYDNYFEEDIEDLDINYNYFNILLKLIKIPL